jgi:hypothetical protein
MHFLIYCHRFTANQRYGILIQNKKRLQQRYARLDEWLALSYLL